MLDDYLMLRTFVYIKHFFIEKESIVCVSYAPWRSSSLFVVKLIHLSIFPNFIFLTQFLTWSDSDETAILGILSFMRHEIRVLHTIENWCSDVQQRCLLFVDSKCAEYMQHTQCTWNSMVFFTWVKKQNLLFFYPCLFRTNLLKWFWRSIAPRENPEENDEEL